MRTRLPLGGLHATVETCDKTSYDKNSRPSNGFEHKMTAKNRKASKTLQGKQTFSYHTRLPYFRVVRGRFTKGFAIA